MVSDFLRAVQHSPACRGATVPLKHDLGRDSNSRRPRRLTLTAGTSALVTRVSNATEFSQSLLVTLKFLLHSDCKQH